MTTDFVSSANHDNNPMWSRERENDGRFARPFLDRPAMVCRTFSTLRIVAEWPAVLDVESWRFSWVRRLRIYVVRLCLWADIPGEVVAVRLRGEMYVDPATLRSNPDRWPFFGHCIQWDIAYRRLCIRTEYMWDACFCFVFFWELLNLPRGHYRWSCELSSGSLLAGRLS